MEPTGGSSTRFDVNWEADSTSFLGQRPPAAISRASRDGASVKDSGSNRYLIVRKTGGRSFNGDQNLFWTSLGGKARTPGLCGLSAAGEHLSDRTRMRVESSISEKYVSDIAEPRRMNANYPLSRSRTEE